MKERHLFHWERCRNCCPQRARGREQMSPGGSEAKHMLLAGKGGTRALLHSLTFPVILSKAPRTLDGHELS